jgi:hypothetical protein
MREQFESKHPVPDGVFLAYLNEGGVKIFAGYTNTLTKFKETADHYNGKWEGWCSGVEAASFLTDALAAIVDNTCYDEHECRMIARSALDSWKRRLE